MAALVAVPMVIPWLMPRFALFQLTLVLVFAIAILGLSLLIGFIGRVSLGHSAFFAFGAYAAAR